MVPSDPGSGFTFDPAAVQQAIADFSAAQSALADLEALQSQLTAHVAAAFTHTPSAGQTVTPAFDKLLSGLRSGDVIRMQVTDALVAVLAAYTGTDAGSAGLFTPDHPR